MKRIPAIKSVMTAFPYSVDITDSVDTAKSLMQLHNIRHLPVTEQQNLVGIITEYDIELLRGVATNSTAAQNHMVADIYKPEPVAVDINERLDHVAVLMADHHIDSVLVTRKSKLVGIFTATDACRYLGRYLQDHFAPPSGDDAA